MISKGYNFEHWYPTRNLKIENDLVVPHIQSFIESKIRVKLTVNDAELMTWPIGSHSFVHVHQAGGRENGDYNSLLYLNDDFEGGEFFTTTGLTIKPIKGRLTFFDGSKIYHGLNHVKNCHRYTLSIWWKNTEFY
jgi:hypothetical protein